MNAITHKIEKVFVEVNTDNLESATYIKNNIGRFLETEIFPKLEQTLDEFNQTGRVARIDSLNLKIATLRDDYFNVLNEEIVKQFFNQIESGIGPLGRKINKEMVNKGVEIIPTEKNREEVFLFFLENGYLPWFGLENDINEILKPEIWQKSLSDHLFFARLIKVIKQHTFVLDRFFYQLDHKSAITFLIKISPELKKTEKDILVLTQSLPRKSHQLFLRFLFCASTGYETQVLVQIARQFSLSLGNIFQPVLSKGLVESRKSPGSASRKNEEQFVRLQSLLTGFFRKTERFSVDEKRMFSEIILTPFKNEHFEISELKEKEQVSFFEKEEGEISVQNAGLVLIHPFLKTFFKAVDILDGKGQIRNSKLHLAVQTLHFLATGNEEFFEGNLVLEKFLCGMSLKMPVEKESLLTKKIKAESLQLLTEIIRRWAVLKNTSPDGLRQMFFQRNGKLIQKDANFKLIVERKAQDILLDKLRWNISLVKIPWRKELLFVEW